jgi:hypothetical protein
MTSGRAGTKRWVLEFEPQRQPMTLWPLPHYDWTNLMMPDFSATGSASDLAA